MEILKTRKEPENKDEQLKLFAEIAAEMGEDISAEDLAEALQEIEVELHQRTDAAASDMEALEDDDLDNVAGGTYYYEDDNPNDPCGGCKNDFTDTNCYWEDGCGVFVKYYGCSKGLKPDYGKCFLADVV